MTYSFAWNAQEQTERSAQIDEYLTTSKNLQREDMDKSIEAALKAQELSIDFDERKLLLAKIYLANGYQYQGQVDTALIILNEVVLRAKVIQDDTLQATAYHTIGLNYQFRGSPELSIENYHHALELNEILGRSKKMLKQLNNIGFLYKDEGEYELALKYLQKCLDISIENGYKDFEFYSYGNIGSILMEQKKYKAALERFEENLRLSHVSNDTVSVGIAKYLIAETKLRQKDYQAAKQYAEEALVITSHYDYAIGKLNSLKILSDVYRQEKKYDQARKTIQTAIQYSKGNSSYMYLEDVLEVQYRIEYEAKNYEKAIAVQKELYTRKDSLNQIKIRGKIANSEFRHLLFKNEQENTLLKIKNENSKKTSFLASTIALLLSLLGIAAFVAYRRSKNYNVLLEKAIQERTKDLENSNKKLAKSNEELERFAFIASHDLKSPLLNIITFSDLLKKESTSFNNTKFKKYLSIIQKEGDRMNNLITDTLEYSRVTHENKESKLEAINLNTILEELIKSMSDTLTEKNASLKIQPLLPTITALPSAIITLFQNLIENGIKYNQSTNPIVEIYAEQNSQFLSIFIKDNGIGISKEYHDKIFVMFSRLHTHNEYVGTGLGLAICKKIVEQLEGEIFIQSNYSSGTILEIKFPESIIVSSPTKKMVVSSATYSSSLS